MSGSDAGVCFPSHQHLVDRCEVSVSTVRRALQELAARKLLSRASFQQEWILHVQWLSTCHRGPPRQIEGAGVHG
jgi:DNA-binding transcriptional MocR family regulator